MGALRIGREGGIDTISPILEINAKVVFWFDEMGKIG
jgi:hypothetical protein